MIKLEEILGTKEEPKKTTEIAFYRELTIIIGEIEDLQTGAEKHAGYLTLARDCRMFSSTDGVREDMKKLAEYFEQEAGKYES